MSGPRILTLEERFWPKVQVTDDCWPWTGSVDGAGYGMFRVGPGRTRRAHRVAWELTYGEAVPDGTVFMHSCDNPPCVRPGHVRPASHGENAADRDAKGRHWTHTGERHGMAKLTAEAVADIRSAPRHTKGICRALADRYGVAVGTVYNIRSRKNSWVGVGR